MGCDWLIVYQQSEFTIRTEADKVRNAIGSWQLHLNRQQLQLQVARRALAWLIPPTTHAAGLLAALL